MSLTNEIYELVGDIGLRILFGEKILHKKEDSVEISLGKEDREMPFSIALHTVYNEDLRKCNSWARQFYIGNYLD